MDAHPVVPGKTTVRIDMLDGLKQGCPLSPLFFILAIDPLLTALSEIPGIDPRCFADDLAVGTNQEENLALALPHIRLWSEISHVRPNMQKTKVITTSPDPPVLSRILPHDWQEVQVTASYVYLGVLIGRSIDVNMVFEAALRKLEGRVAHLMPIQRLFSTGAGELRVRRSFHLVHRRTLA